MLKILLSGLGLRVIRRSTVQQVVSEYPWLGERLGEPAPARAAVRPAPAADVEGPSASDPRLAELRRRYAGHPATAHTVWSAENLATELDLSRFRADNAYVWQTRVNNPIQYLLAAYYARDHDTFGLYQHLTEDGAFGAFTYEHAGRTTSRDVLDSIMEIAFLERTIEVSQIPELTVLDIGAGYGRLGVRMAQSLPNLERYLCTDAVAESTFVSEFYTHFRGVSDRVHVVPLDEVESVTAKAKIHLAVNIHSFSECALASIEFWLDIVARAGVPWLFIVPNTGDQLISWERDGSRLDFLPAIQARGYEIAAKRSKYEDEAEVERYGLFPSTYFLFRRIVGS